MGNRILDYNIDGYRKAKKRALRGKIGAWALLSEDRGPVVFLLSKSLDKMQEACKHYLSLPRTFIRGGKKDRYGYWYLKLYGIQVLKYKALRREKSKWSALNR